MARGYFLGQLPDDHVSEVCPKADESAGHAGAADEIHFDAVLDAAEPHLDRLEASLGTDLHDHAETRVQEEPSGATALVEVEPDYAGAVPTSPMRRVPRRRATARTRTHDRRSRVAAAVTVVAVLLAGTGLYVRSQADAADKRARPPMSTSREQRSRPTTGPPASVEVAPQTDLAPASAAVPGSQPAAPQGPSSTPSQGTAPRAPASASSAPAPGSTGAPPANTAPPSAPPRSPTCQLLPVLCP